ncbi:MAG: 4'-phosphopantetheinyl transferase superfamily protein [Halanaerobiales bacterium]|nr:4'-phosphopantetheinyl transferase superfamily protein [Halanaerobiales bacterium]
MKTQLYVIPLGEQMTLAEQISFLPFIPAVKRERVKAFRYWQDAQRTILGYSLLTFALNQLTGLPRDEMEFTFDYYGKPHIKNCPYHFNLSHAGDWIACAISSDIVGVDVEKIQNIDLSIAEHFFAEPEAHDLFLLPEEKRKEYFFKLWTLKESYIKAEGKGVSIPLDSFWFHVSEDEEIQFDTHAKTKDWNFKLFDFNPGYKLAICVLNSNFPDVQFISRDKIK